MQVLQLFYTSCETGLSSGKGFQTYSMSSGIRAEERREIESLCNYRPPEDLPTQPIPEEIFNLFPITFGCRQLQSGRYVVWQITYLGQDYSGRYGNYFVHALVLEPTTLDFNTLAVYPIQWYRSKVFRQCLTDSEAAVTSSPEPLPVLDIQKLVPNPDLTFAEVASFLKEDDRRTLLAPLFSALLDYPTTHRRLVLVDEPASIPYWMAALQLAFPKKLVPHLSFLTYTYDPHTTGELVCATQENTRFNVANSSQNFSFFVVNGLDKSFNQTVNHYEVVDLIETSYLFHEGNLNAFHTFLEATDYDALDADLEAAYYLYLITHSEVADLNNKIAPALQFANRYVTHSKLLGELALRLDQVIDNMVGKLDLQNARVVVQFLLKVAQAGTNYLQIAANFYRGFLNHFIFESPFTLADLTQFNHAVLANSPFANELRKQLIDDAKNLKPLRHLMAKATPERIEIGLTLFSETCLAIGPDLPTTSEVIFLEGFITLSKSPSHLQSYLDALLQKNGQFFIQVIVLVWSQVPHVQTVLLDGLQLVLRSLDASKVLSIRRELIKLKQFHLVFEMFKQAFAQAPDRVKFFWTEHQTLFAAIPSYGDAYFAEAVKQYDEYLTTLSEDEQRPLVATEYQKLLTVASLIKDKQVLSTLVSKIEIHLSFSSDKKNLEQANQLAILKKSLGVKTKLDVCSLVLFGFKLTEIRRGKTSLSELLTSPDRPNMAEFRNCDTEEECQRHRMMFCDYLHWILPLLLKWKPSAQEQGLIFTYLNPQGYLEEDLVELYLAYVTDYLKENQKEVDWLDEFLVFYFNCQERPKTMTRSQVKTALLNLPKVYLSYLQSNLKARKAIVESKQTSFALFMRELRKELKGVKEEQSGGLLSKLFSRKK